MKNTKTETPKQEQPTTVRASVTHDEHAAIKLVAKTRLGTTIEDLLRRAIDMYLKSTTGKDLITLAEEAANRDKYIQGDLFEQGGAD